MVELVVVVEATELVVGGGIVVVTTCSVVVVGIVVVVVVTTDVGSEVSEDAHPPAKRASARGTKRTNMESGAYPGRLATAQTKEGRL